MSLRFPHSCSVFPTVRSPLPTLLLATCLGGVLAACGGGGSGSADAGGVVQLDDTVVLHMDLWSVPAEAQALTTTPYFHALPALLDAPEVQGAGGNERSVPHSQRISSASAALGTRGVTVQEIQQWTDRVAAQNGADPIATAMASGTVTSTYTPAQIRAAYGLPAMPSSNTAWSALQAAQMGAGQTIYIIGAYHNPNAAAELAAFNQKFGLPTCATKTLSTTATLPLPRASTTSCELIVVYNTAAGGMTSTAPAYNAGWATELALDVQWSHATAPGARIVLIEAPDASVNSLVGSIKLANAMGPGIVSMSFGAPEGSWTPSVDAVFTAAQMTYLAATGDSGVSVSWPSVSPNVLAVGGTTLTYSGTGSRSEVSWSGTGGGISAYMSPPSYQSNTVPGMGMTTRRVVADVAFNADPATGQYTAVMSPGSTTVNWLSVGGTSLSTPQWAGLLAVVNAHRSLNAKTPLGLAHTTLYGQLASVPGTYAASFADITRGSHGTCATCTAKVGYDQLTGLGTPNANSLISSASGATSASSAPAMAATTISAVVDKPLTFTASAVAPNPVTFTMAGAPTGMTMTTAGVATWAKPVAGQYAATITAKDSKTGLTASAVYTIKVSSAGPSISASALTGTAGKAFTGSFTVADASASRLSITISGVPAGMGFSVSGNTIRANWAKPVKGSYNLLIVVTNNNGLSTQTTWAITIL